MIIEKIKKQAIVNSNRLAYKVNGKGITYKELINIVQENSSYLKKQGNFPVIIYGSKSISTFVAIISCLFANRAYVPVSTSTPFSRLKDIIRLTDAELLITDEKIVVDEIDCVSLKDLIKYRNLEEKDNINDIAYIIFTSGSTGEPKGVPISYENLENFVDWISKLNPLSNYRHINVLNQANFSFDLSVADIYYSICNGHTLVALDIDIQEEYDKIFRVLQNEKINLIVATPTFIKLCLVNADFNKNKICNLDCIYFCGEQLEVKVAQKLFERFPELQIINAYGPTEATSAVSATIIKKEYIGEFDLLPVGDINSAATTIEIENDEIVLKGKSVFRGYLGNFVGGYYNDSGTNCYRTGDIGYVKGNQLFVRGRIDDQIKYKGYRIEISDIEINLNKITGVSDSMVVPLKDKNGLVKSLKAYVVTDKTIEYLKKNLELLIPNYMVPTNFEVVDALPINRNVKIDRRVVIK